MNSFLDLYNLDRVVRVLTSAMAGTDEMRGWLEANGIDPGVVWRVDRKVRAEYVILVLSCYAKNEKGRLYIDEKTSGVAMMPVRIMTEKVAPPPLIDGAFSMVRDYAQRVGIRLPV